MNRLSAVVKEPAKFCQNVLYYVALIVQVFFKKIIL